MCKVRSRGGHTDRIKITENRILFKWNLGIESRVDFLILKKFRQAQQKIWIEWICRVSALNFQDVFRSTISIFSSRMEPNSYTSSDSHFGRWLMLDFFLPRSPRWLLPTMQKSFLVAMKMEKLRRERKSYDFWQIYIFSSVWKVQLVVDSMWHPSGQLFVSYEWHKRIFSGFLHSFLFIIVLISVSGRRKTTEILIFRFLLFLWSEFWYAKTLDKKMNNRENVQTNNEKLLLMIWNNARHEIIRANEENWKFVCLIFSSSYIFPQNPTHDHTKWENSSSLTWKRSRNMLPRSVR